jgi:hypothetical protein
MNNRKIVLFFKTITNHILSFHIPCLKFFVKWVMKFVLLSAVTIEYFEGRKNNEKNAYGRYGSINDRAI